MGKVENKTVPTGVDVADFLATLDDDEQRRDSETLIGLMQEVSGEPPVMWGPSIIGFGSYHYKYASGYEGDICKIGFSPRKGKLSLYIVIDTTRYPELMKKLGKHTTSKACIYAKRLDDLNRDVLMELMRKSYRDITKQFSGN